MAAHGTRPCQRLGALVTCPTGSALLLLFPPEEQDRVSSGALRYALLHGGAEEELIEMINDMVGEAMASRWGMPATYANPIPPIAHALSRPGHYGEQPTIVGDKADAILAAMSSFWPSLQYSEFLTVGMGSAWRYVEAVPADEQIDPSMPDGTTRCTLQILPHHVLWCTPHPRSATVPIVVRWLRIRPDDRPGSTDQIAVWDIWDVSDPAAPSYTVRRAESGGKIGRAYLSGSLDRVGLEGETSYPWVTPSGAPYLPWSCVRRQESGDLYNWKIGQHEPYAAGAVICSETEVAAVARQSTGKIAIIIGAQIEGMTTRATGNGVVMQVIDAQPGDILHAKLTDQGTSASVVEIGGVEHLDSLAGEANRLSMRLSTLMGISPSDATRVGSNPMSGAALHITNASKREEQRRMTPLCREADARTIRHVMWCQGEDPGSFAVDYVVIKASPDEEREAREADEWSIDQGLESKIDVYQRRNPGLSREEAIKRLQQIAKDEALLTPKPAQAPPIPPPAQDPPEQVDEMTDDMEADDGAT